jgi:hypothetical protein
MEYVEAHNEEGRPIVDGPQKARKSELLAVDGQISAGRKIAGSRSMM